MHVSQMKYTIAPTVAILLLASCDAANAPSTPTASQPNVSRTIKHNTSPCPCFYVTDRQPPRYAVTVYASDASGNAEPVQRIKGARTGLYYPEGLTLDGSGNVYVTNRFGSGSYNGAVTVYAPGATGNIAPTTTIQGSNTGLEAPLGIVIDPLNANIYVTNVFGGPSSLGSITIYSPGSHGNVAPAGVIEGSYTGLDNPHGIALDLNGNIYVANESNNSITVYAAGSTGNVTPIRTVTGRKTKLSSPVLLVLDSSLNIYVANIANNSVTVYAAGATRNVAPIQQVIGTATELNNPYGVAVDGADNIYVTNFSDGNYRKSSVTIYAAGATGNVAPSNTIAGRNTHLYGAAGLAIQ